jgi:hypothetical protein
MAIVMPQDSCFWTSAFYMRCLHLNCKRRRKGSKKPSLTLCTDKFEASIAGFLSFMKYPG